MKQATYMIGKDGSCTIEHYNHAPAFSNFLPGIAGMNGIPLWAFYVNRAQGIASFGFKDKDHSVVEFLPANKSYYAVFHKGFRTFLKIGNLFYEPFIAHTSDSIVQRMTIHSSWFQIQELNKKLGLEIVVRYSVLSEQPVAGLVRKVSLINHSRKKISVQLLDGLPVLIPYGIKNILLKDLSRTIEAWMEVDCRKELSLFKLKISPEDVAATHYIQGANFYTSFFTEKKVVFSKLIVDPDCIFQDNSSLTLPYKFLEKKFRYPSEQITYGKTPAAMSFFAKDIPASSAFTFYSVVGSAEDLKFLKPFSKKVKVPLFIENNFQAGNALLDSIKDNTFTVSAVRVFDEYVRTTYLDNVLRGGMPVTVGAQKTWYVFSRKHGDLERDYNKFKLPSVYFSQGEGNFRDINQNRRLDVYFNPDIQNLNIRLFFNLQDQFGYNPLVVKQELLVLSDKAALEAVIQEFFGGVSRERAREFLQAEFTVENLSSFLSEQELSQAKMYRCIEKVLAVAERYEHADFAEGFWIDHWLYNIDLLESYLMIYPEKLSQLLFKEKFYFYDGAYRINPRSAKYYRDIHGKIRQHNFLVLDSGKMKLLQERTSLKHRVRDGSGRGEIVQVSLVVKLLTLLVNKIATLDAFGIGIEMEAGKPGWCDALNGLPALFGSSVNETMALLRLARFLQRAFDESPEIQDAIACPKELADFIRCIHVLLERYPTEDASRAFSYWDESNAAKELYRDAAFFGFSETVCLTREEISLFVGKVIRKTQQALNWARNGLLVHAFYTHEVVRYEHVNGTIKSLEFKKHPLPVFLEGVVHLLRVAEQDEIPLIVREVKKSQLFDKKLSMYKLNGSLAGESLEIGRMRVFNRGWLENESIWLHMEYKYLLELLKAGLYREFYENIKKCFVCFLQPGTYGRNILENSSFIVSSAYPDKKLWGRGFVARLSGSTAELVHMWILLCAGKSPFFTRDGKLFLSFAPALPGDFFTVKPEQRSVYWQKKHQHIFLPANTFCFKFLKDTLVVYYNPSRKDTFSNTLKITSVKLFYRNGEEKIVSGGVIAHSDAVRIRKDECFKIEVFFGKQ